MPADSQHNPPIPQTGNREETTVRNYFVSDHAPFSFSLARDRAALPRGLHPPPPAPSGPSQEGTHVEHTSFGPGVVQQVRGIGERQAALVRFEDGRARVVILRYLRPRAESADEVVVVAVDDAGGFEP